MRGITSLLGLLVLGFATSSPGVTLYDSSQNNFPEEQGWLFYGNDGTVSRAVTAGELSFSTVGSTTRAGWSNTIPIINTLVNPSFPTLNRTNGFVLGFDLRIKSEAHTSTDRAGFDVILLGNDHQGIELGFWADEIFAQSATFTHAEGVAQNNDNLIHYDLGIHGSSYELFANGSQILTGPVRDYSGALAVPYGLNNYLFFGDNTTSAQVSTFMRNVSIVPEPLLGGAIIPLLMTLRRRH
jgi:hypothetical protein